jgi:hypothetical protein
MNFPIQHILSNIHQQNFNFLPAHTQKPRHQRQAERLQPLHDVRHHPACQILVARVLGPGVLWPLVLELDDVDEAGFSHPLRVLRGDVAAAAGYHAGFDHVLVPGPEGGVRGDGVVVGFHGHVGVLHFEVAAWFEVAVLRGNGK